MTDVADDRALILRRRARLVGAALLALSGSCAGREPARAPGTPEVSVPQASANEPEPVTNTGSRPVSTQVQRKLPPLDVPANADGVARSMHETLAKQVPAINVAIDELEKSTPAVCDLSAAACERSWHMHARRLDELAVDAIGLRTECPGSSETAKAYAARVEEHIAFLNVRLSALERAIEDGFAQRGSAALAAWQKLRAYEKPSPPMVCLDCADW
jgi:hypothetical protein